MARIILVIIQDQELTGPYYNLATANPIALLSAKHRFQRQTPHVVITMCVRAQGIENNVVLFEPAEMGMLIKSRLRMIR